MFLGLPDREPDPLVRGMDPDPDPYIIMQKYYFVTLFDFFSLENYVNVSSKSNKQKKCFIKKNFLLAS
jgi:hypothetical protein